MFQLPFTAERLIMSVFKKIAKVWAIIATVPVSILAMIPRNHCGIIYRTATASVADLVRVYDYDAAFQKQCIIGLSALGGAHCSKVNQADIDAIIEHMANGGKSGAAKVMKAICKPGYQIVLVKDFIQNLTKTEKKAVMYHELGHMVNGDLEGEKKSGLVLNLGYEVAADAYAAKHVGKVAMRNALIKMRDNTFLRMSSIMTPEELESAQVEMYGDDAIITIRIAALQ